MRADARRGRPQAHRVRLRAGAAHCQCRSARGAAGRRPAAGSNRLACYKQVLVTLDMPTSISSSTSRDAGGQRDGDRDGGQADHRPELGPARTLDDTEEGQGRPRPRSAGGHPSDDTALYRTALKILLRLTSGPAAAAGRGLPLLAVRDGARTALLELVARDRAVGRPCRGARHARPAAVVPDARTCACRGRGRRQSRRPRRLPAPGLRSTTRARRASTSSSASCGWSSASRTPARPAARARSGSGCAAASFDRIVDGEYRARGDRSTCASSRRGPRSFYAERFPAIVKDAGDGIASAGRRARPTGCAAKRGPATPTRLCAPAWTDADDTRSRAPRAPPPSWSRTDGMPSGSAPGRRSAHLLDALAAAWPDRDPLRRDLDRDRAARARARPRGRGSSTRSSGSTSRSTAPTRSIPPAGSSRAAAARTPREDRRGGRRPLRRHRRLDEGRRCAPRAGAASSCTPTGCRRRSRARRRVVRVDAPPSPDDGVIADVHSAVRRPSRPRGAAVADARRRRPRALPRRAGRPTCSSPARDEVEHRTVRLRRYSRSSSATHSMCVRLREHVDRPHARAARSRPRRAARRWARASSGCTRRRRSASAPPR